MVFDIIEKILQTIGKILTSFPVFVVLVLLLLYPLVEGILVKLKTRKIQKLTRQHENSCIIAAKIADVNINSEFLDLKECRKFLKKLRKILQIEMQINHLTTIQKQYPLIYKEQTDGMPLIYTKYGFYPNSKDNILKLSTITEIDWRKMENQKYDKIYNDIKNKYPLSLKKYKRINKISGFLSFEQKKDLATSEWPWKEEEILKKELYYDQKLKLIKEKYSWACLDYIEKNLNIQIDVKHQGLIYIPNVIDVYWGKMTMEQKAELVTRSEKLWKKEQKAFEDEQNEQMAQAIESLKKEKEKMEKEKNYSQKLKSIKENYSKACIDYIENFLNIHIDHQSWVDIPNVIDACWKEMTMEQKAELVNRPEKLWKKEQKKIEDEENEILEQLFEQDERNNKFRELIQKYPLGYEKLTNEEERRFISSNQWDVKWDLDVIEEFLKSAQIEVESSKKTTQKKKEDKKLLLKKQDIGKSIKELPLLIESNNIEQIESKIKFINENIDLVAKEDKDEFEYIKIDYKNKKELGIPQGEEMLFVNYDIPKIKFEEGYYAIVRMPQKDCIVWPYRRRTIARRGYMELDFENTLKKYLPSKVNVLGDVNILPQNGVRPYEPDIALIYSENGLNVRIDVEIDEPYAAVTDKPTHYIGCGDDNRDANLNCLGWIVIRFSECQIFQQTIKCVKFVADIIKSIDNTFDIPKLANISKLESEKQWTKIQCQKWATEKYRQQYLQHEFGQTEESLYYINDLKLTEFETSILDKVKPTVVSNSTSNTLIIEEDDFNNDNNLLYNEVNRFEQDRHIKFNASQHVYTVDGIQYYSVSSVISDLFPEFDSEYWSAVKGRQRGIPFQQVKEEWESKGQKSREVGTFLHQQIENQFLQRSINRIYRFTYHGTYVHEDCTIDIDKELKFFNNFIAKTIIQPYRSEWRIFDKSLKIAGTIDMISKNNDGTYDIYDWKRSSRLYKDNPFQHGLGQLHHLEDTPRNHYYLQQNLYRYILEHQYGLKIRFMKLVVLHSDYNDYDVIVVPEMDMEISTIIEML